MDGLGLNFKDERMETKHTPWPWAHHNTPTPFIYVNAGGLPICQIYTSTAHGQSMGEQFANARLIAAAPELLEAAIELKDVCNRPSAARTRAEAWRKLDKAIAKALQPNAEVSGLSTRPPC